MTIINGKLCAMKKEKKTRQIFPTVNILQKNFVTLRHCRQIMFNAQKLFIDAFQEITLALAKANNIRMKNIKTNK